MLTHKIASILSWLGLFTAPAKTANYNIQDINIYCDAHKTRIEQDYKVHLKHAIAIKSDDEDFGGLSGMLIQSDKKQLFAISDRARLFSMTPVFDGNNNITCLSSATKRPLRGRSTRPLIGHYGDSEGFTFQHENEKKVLISFERAHRVVEYDLSMDQLLPQMDYDALTIRELPYNKSYETVRTISKDEILAFPEGYEVKQGILKGYLYNILDNSTTDIAIEKYDGHYMTDIARLHNGDFITLERRFSLLTGVSTIMRHIKHQDLISGNPTTGEIVFHMTSAEGADNFEGISVLHEGHKNNIYIISDDNFTSLQKTILLSLEYEFFR